MHHTKKKEKENEKKNKPHIVNEWKSFWINGLIVGHFCEKLWEISAANGIDFNVDFDLVNQ